MKITESGMQILRRALRKHAPHLEGYLNQDVLNLPLTLRNEMRWALGGLFADEGLREDDEPNAHGLAIEDVIGLLGPRRDDDLQ